MRRAGLRRPVGRTIARMALASTGSDLVTAVCMTVVIGMAGLLVFRATRARAEDADEDDGGDQPT
jgi:hypothetical protein